MVVLMLIPVQDAQQLPHIVFAQSAATADQDEMIPSLPPGPPLAQYALFHRVLSGMPKPFVIRQNQTVELTVTVKNEENFSLYNVQIFDFDPSGYFKLANLSKIDVLEPHSTKAIHGNITAAYNVTGDPQLNEAWLSWRIVAENNTGEKMETMQFYRPVTIEPALDKQSSVPEFSSSSPLPTFVLGLGLAGIMISINIIRRKKHTLFINN